MTTHTYARLVGTVDDLARVKDERDRLRRAAAAVLAVLDQQSVIVREAEAVTALRAALGGAR